MSSSVSMDFIEALYVIGISAATGIGLYAAYWSLSIRRAMMVRAYKRQALTVAIFSLYGIVLFSLFYTTSFFVPSLGSEIAGELSLGVLYGLLPLVVLAWADSSIRVGRKSDPLLRDTMQWSKTRLIVLPLMIVLLVPFFLSSGTVASIGFVLSFVLDGIAALGVFFAARRSGDANFRRSLEWFGIFVLLLIVQNAGFMILTSYVSNVFNFTPVNLAWGVIANLFLAPVVFYSIYKCSRSLVPLNKIEKI